MIDPPGRRVTSWQDDAKGGLRSIGIEALTVVLLVAVAVIVARVALLAV